jgi:hypothetical protein
MIMTVLFIQVLIYHLESYTLRHGIPMYIHVCTCQWYQPEPETRNPDERLRKLEGGTENELEIYTFDIDSSRLYTGTLRQIVKDLKLY